ncbi:hypothetical protein DFQ11_102625 [Winogradskyella epiphytica]|uniref:Tic20 family protein n=1 Tax=Winogradskyella epiphytica TaxID=262005 RepID=A0A2V4XG60_9FLAO|nr:DUF4870 domain-containing protein [Winogradskyella epiphytica]PYE82045.1 hypothetical protein DFQ11_102625 [Winogradskyella epiphytica]GGW60851.1 hypothetical protein GCM10008085_10490 [Winogradskyella epiphytica]
MIDNHHKNLATFIHLSTFSRFLIPFGNFIGPIVLWSVNKDKSEFVDQHGKQAINFQISVLLYAIIIGTLSVPFFIFKLFKGLDVIDFNGFHNFHINIGEPSPLLYIGGGLGVLAVLAFIIELALIIKASLSARDGKMFNYPLTIKFLK